MYKDPPQQEGPALEEIHSQNCQKTLEVWRLAFGVYYSRAF